MQIDKCQQIRQSSSRELVAHGKSNNEQHTHCKCHLCTVTFPLLLLLLDHHFLGFLHEWPRRYFNGTPMILPMFLRLFHSHLQILVLHQMTDNLSHSQRLTHRLDY